MEAESEAQFTYCQIYEYIKDLMFDQKKMTQHLETYFRLSKLSCFPHSIGYKPKEMHFPLHEIEVFFFVPVKCHRHGMTWYAVTPVKNGITFRCINLHQMVKNSGFVAHVL